MRDAHLLIIFLIGFAHASAEETHFEDIPIQITPGVFWKPLPQAVLYEGSVPIFYELPWPSHDVDMETEPLTKSACQNNSYPEICDMAKWLDTVDENISAELEKANTAMTQTAGIHRIPRSIGKIFIILLWRSNNKRF